jgi:hypothetical protein
MKDPKDKHYSDDELDNHSDQLNPNNDAYWTSRGYDERPDDWNDRIENDED